MHLPRSNEAGNSPRESTPIEPDADPTPLPSQDDSEERSWESLGSTHVVQGETPENIPRPETAPTETDAVDARIVPKVQEPDVVGDFRRVRKIGEGAMGAVYLARQISFARDVALKVLFPHIAANPKLVQRLYREGQVMGRLDHPNIVQAYEVGEDKGWHYIALEYVDGISLQKWLQRLGRLSLGDTLLIAITVAKALDYAHKENIVHRDIKPDNVLITHDGKIKVADLGMVKIDEEDMALTQTGHAVGTPWYMPLEQAKNAKDTDGRSDIYALGCMVYCMLTGTPPFAGKTLVDVIQAKEIGTFPPARQSCSDVPERLDLIIVKMTAKHPKYRYQTCGELVKDLESLNLANPALSFLADEEDSGPALSDPGVATSADTRPDYDPNIWYVRIKDPDGRAIVKKLPTAQVHKLLEEDTLAPNTKASHQAHEGFRALATYKEFQGIALVKASQQAVDQQSVRYRTLYKKIEEKERQRQEDENPQAKTPDWLADLQPLLRSYGPLVFGALLGLVALVWLVRSFWR